MASTDASQSQPNTPMRRLGPMEMFHAVLHDLRLYVNIAGSAQFCYRPHEGQPLTKEQLHSRILRATIKVVERHPALCVGIKSNSRSPEYIRLGRIDMDNLVSFEQSDVSKDNIRHLELTLAQEHERPFETLGTTPCWRLRILSHSQPGWITVIFIVHHSISDGSSLKVFLESFHSALNETSATPDAAGKEAHIYYPPADTKMLPSVHDAVKISPTYRSVPVVAHALWQMVAPRFLQRPDKKLWGGPPSPPESSVPKCRTVERIAFLSSTVADALRIACREHKTTVTAIFYALLGREVALTYPGYPHGYLTQFPVSLSRFYKPAQEDIVDYPSSGHITLPPSIATSPIWETAQLCHRNLAKAVRTPRDTPAGLLVYVDDFVQFFQSKLDKPREEGFRINSVGVAKASQDKEWAMDCMVQSTAMEPTGSSMVLALVTVQGGHMGLTFSWSDDGGKVNEQDMESLFKRVITALWDLLNLDEEARQQITWSL